MSLSSKLCGVTKKRHGYNIAIQVKSLNQHEASKQRAAKLCGAPLLLITSHGDSPPCKPNPCERCSHFLLSEAEGAPGEGGEAGEVTVGDHHLEAQGQHSHQDNLQVPRVRIHGGQGRLMQGSSNQRQQSPKRKSKPTVI